MNDLSYSESLRELSKDYYQHHISVEEYRSNRKLILDKIDEEFNGVKPEVTSTDNQDTSLFMKTIAFFKNTDA